jgi:hypothetical protein
VGQDVILRADCQSALCGWPASVRKRVANPPPAAGLPHKPPNSGEGPDTAHGASADETSAGIEEIVKLVHGKSPSTKILLLGILPSQVWDVKSRKDAEVNQYLAKRYSGVAYLTYLDIGDIFRKNGQLDTSLFYDPHVPARGALHPDTLGQHRMAAAIEPALSKLLGDRCKCEQSASPGVANGHAAVRAPLRVRATITLHQ